MFGCQFQLSNKTISTYIFNVNPPVHGHSFLSQLKGHKKKSTQLAVYLISNYIILELIELRIDFELKQLVNLFKLFVKVSAYFK